jgi:type I restriction enzyme, S subunit
MNQVTDARLPAEWHEVALREAVSFTRKPRNLRYADFEEVPFVPMELVPIGHLYFEDFEVRQGAEVNSGTYFEPGDMLLAKITPSFENGKQGIIRELPTPFGVATTEVIPLVGIPDVSDTLYLFYYLLRGEVRSDLAGKMEGTTGRQRLSQRAVEDLRVPLPPLPEQRAIAHILRAVQAAREARQREVSLERERKAALMAHLFTHGTRGESTKQTPIGEMPVSWEVRTFGELTDIQAGGTPSRLKPDYYGGTIQWVKTLDLNDSVVVDTEEKITEAGLQSIRGDVRAPQTVMVAMYGGAGTVGKAGILGVFAATNQAVCCLMPNPDTFDSYWLLCYLLHIRPDWMRRAIGTRKDPNIGKGIIETHPVPLPPLDEQHAIADILRACDAKIAALERESALLDELFRALLEELMTGRVAVAEMGEGNG